MKKKKEILKNVKECYEILNDMITKAEEMKANNFEMLYSLRYSIIELENLIKNQNQNINTFLVKWEKNMSWVSRVFEGHPILDIILEIDEFVLDLSKKI